MLSTSTHQTKTLASALAHTLKGNEVIALEGDLGSGKTTFAQGLCEALGVDPLVVRSPTFTIMNLYKATHPTIHTILHIDCYRLKSTQEIQALGLEEWLHQPGVVTLVEWPHLVEGINWNPTAIYKFRLINETEREIVVS